MTGWPPSVPADSPRPARSGARGSRPRRVGFAEPRPATGPTTDRPLAVFRRRGPISLLDRGGRARRLLLLEGRRGAGVGLAWGRAAGPTGPAAGLTPRTRGWRSSGAATRRRTRKRRSVVGHVISRKVSRSGRPPSPGPVRTSLTMARAERTSARARRAEQARRSLPARGRGLSWGGESLNTNRS